MMLVKTIWAWLWCITDRDRTAKSSAEKLQMSMRVTAKSRYNAATRLQNQGKCASFTTTSLSLGLVFIPLMQNAAIPLAFKPNVLNMMQIFLSVSTLIYSIVIETARFNTRAEKFTDCANRLKELIREIDNERETSANFTKEQLAEYQRRYSDIATDSENHSKSDFHLAMLEMRNQYHITGIPRLTMYMNALFSTSIAYLVPLLMIFFEVIFITDMVGATKVLVPYLNGVAVSS